VTNGRNPALQFKFLIESNIARDRCAADVERVIGFDQDRRLHVAGLWQISFLLARDAGSQIMPGAAHRLESNLGVTPVRGGIAQIDVEAGHRTALGEDAVDQRSGYRGGIAAATQGGRRIDACDRGAMARTANNARHRHWLAINDPESIVSAGCSLLHSIGRRQRIIWRRLLEECDEPLSEQLGVGEVHCAHGPAHLQVAWAVTYRVNLFWNRFGKSHAAFNGTLNEPQHSRIAANHARIIEAERFVGQRAALGLVEFAEDDGMPSKNHQREPRWQRASRTTMMPSSKCIR
jgi:hypothetical protein